MKQQPFEHRHQSFWAHFSEQLELLERSRKSGAFQEFPAHYRILCQHLALAEQRAYSPYLIEHLQQLAQRGHQQLYRQRSPLHGRILSFILADLPREVRAQWRSLAIASALFYLSFALMAGLCYFWPELTYSLIDPDQVHALERMYDPEARRLGHFAERGSADDWQMFGYYIMNNIGIAFQTFASGLLWGLGSLFFLLFNGLMIGATAGHLSQIGYNATFWPFVIGHGAFELTAITFSGAAGLQLGWALLAPQRFNRLTALRLAAQRAIKLVLGALLFLIIAAFIEAYWSSMTVFSVRSKLLVGALLWALVGTYLARAGRQYAPS